MAPKPRGQIDEPEGDDRFLDEGSDEPVQDELEDDELEGSGDEEALEEGEEEAGEGGTVETSRRRAPQQPDPEVEALRRENELLRRQQPQQPVYTGPREETEDEFNNRVAQLEPFEQLSARQQRAERRSQAAMAYMQASMADQMDRATYQARAATDPRFSKFQAEVERRHQAFLAGGPGQPPQLVPRETILKIVLGERQLAPVTRDQRRKQEHQQRKLERHSSKPPNARGDAGSGRPERSGARDTEREARRRRLENLEI